MTCKPRKDIPESFVYDMKSTRSLYPQELQPRIRIEEHYEHIADWTEALNSNLRYPTTWDSSDTGVNSPADDWHGGVTYEQALELMNKGWPEGRATLASNVVMARMHTTLSRAPSFTLDVGGSNPNVPVAVSGDLMCMFSPTDEEIATKPTLILYTEEVVSCVVNERVIRNRGAALLSHVEAIESAGFPCQIIMRFGVGGLYSRRDSVSQGTILDITLKRAGDPLDLDRCAFFLLHPAHLRRLVFAYENHRPGFDLGTGYGSPQGAKLREVPPGQPGILVPSGNEFTSDYSTVEGGVERIRKLIGTGLMALPNMRCEPLRWYYQDNYSEYDVDD